MNDNQVFDLIIIGAGPGGYNLALDAKKKGLKTLLIEKNSLGGTCLNHGCIPTKAYYASSELILKLKESEKLGISSSFTFDFSKIKERKDSVVSALKDGIKFSLDKAGVTIINGSGKLNKNREVIVNDEAYTAKNIVIATGSKEAIIPIKGYENCVTSTDILNLETLPTSLTIIGGGVIGVEVASIFNEFGVKVTIIEMQKTILPNLDLEIVRRLSSYLKQRGISIITNAKVCEIEKDKVHYLLGEKEEIVDTQMTLMAIGRSPNIDDLGLDDALINYTKRGIEVDQFFETNQKGIYAIGDCNGKVMLAHFAEASGKLVLAHILGEKCSTDTNIVPSCVFTFPEVAVVGKTEEELKISGVDYKANKVLYRSNGKALASGETDGFIKVLSVNDELVGVHILGFSASTIIHEAAIMMNKKIKLCEAKDYIFSHPTLSEIFRDSLNA